MIKLIKQLQYLCVFMIKLFVEYISIRLKKWNKITIPN